METYNSLQRVLTALGQKEPDKVPLFLLLSLHGAKALNISIKDYFSKAENIVEGQLKMMRKYNNDCIYAFFYAPLETEICGGDVIYRNDGPPNSGRPFIKSVEDIRSYAPPVPEQTKELEKVFKAIGLLKSEVQDTVPIIGVVMSPFSLPVMQMGFDKYLELMVYHQADFELLMQKNGQFCVAWANAQINAGATAICYFDPVSSSSIITREQYLNTGYKIAKRTLGQIKGPSATHFASGRCLPILKDVAETGTAIVGVSCLEDMADLKQVARGKFSLLGNLNGIGMANWSAREAENQVKSIIQKAGKGGGLLISDNHGEIPYQVQDITLRAIAKAVKTWGTYPLNWF